MTNAKYRNEWIEAEKAGSDFGTSFKLAAVDGINAVFVLDMDDKPIGAVHTTPERNEILARFILGDGEKGMSTGTAAALVEEMLAKMYDQMKARVLTAIEAATGQTGIGDKPLGRQIGYALDDAKRVALEVLEKRAPEITPEMLKAAVDERILSEWRTSIRANWERGWLSDETTDMKVRFLEDEIRRLKNNQAKQEEEAVKRHLHGVLRDATVDDMRRALEVLPGGRPNVTVNANLSGQRDAKAVADALTRSTTKAISELHTGFAAGKTQG